MSEISIMEAEEYLLGIPRFTRKNEPEKTGAFLSFLSKKYPLPKTTKVIHIAGTNGKGSVCAYLRSVLMEAGFQVGMFTSPHLVEMRERFAINLDMVTEEEFVSGFLAVKEQVECYRQNRDEQYHPTFFEYLFFMANVIYSKNPVDYLILETGLGGRLDATNQIKNPALCVITKIGLDHTQYLGDTIARIAAEKAGIIKKGVPVVYLEDKKEAGDVIRRKAEELGSAAFSVSKRDYAFLKNGYKTIDFSYTSRYYGFIEVSLKTRALYQMENASLAIKALEVLETPGFFTKEQIQKGLESMSWAGRMEEVLPDVYVDGAHNEDGICAFLETVRNDECDGRKLLLFSVVEDKNYRAMIELLMQEHYFSLVYTASLMSDRGVDADRLEECFSPYRQKGQQIMIAENIEEAFRRILREKRTGDKVYIVGSLYLVGQIKALLRE